MAIGLQTHIWNNNLKSVLLLAGYPVLLILLMWLFFMGMALGAPQSTTATVIAAGVQGVARYWYFMVLAAGLWFAVAWWMHQGMINAATGAKPLTRAENMRVYNLLENLCIARGMVMPQLFVIESAALNAYASGISDASYAVTVTRGLMEVLDDAELEAVLAHELTHISNRDVRLLIIGVIFVGMISFFAEMVWRNLNFRGEGKGRMMIVAGIVLAIGYVFAVMIRFAISRKREYLADAGAVELTKNPDAMANALRKISGHAKMDDVPAEVQQMFIENSADFFGMFATHPPIEARIRVLEDVMGAQRLVWVPEPGVSGARSPWRRSQW